jgi:hypothetical protein
MSRAGDDVAVVTGAITEARLAISFSLFAILASATAMAFVDPWCAVALPATTPDCRSVVGRRALARPRVHHAGRVPRAAQHVNIASIAGLTKTLAKEWGRYNVTVNTVAFGIITARLTSVSSDSDGTIDVEGRQIKVGVDPQVLAAAEAGIPESTTSVRRPWCAAAGSTSDRACRTAYRADPRRRPRKSPTSHDTGSYVRFALPRASASVKESSISLTPHPFSVLDGHVTRADRTTVTVAMAAATPLIACALLAVFRSSFANTNAALILVLVVVAFAATGLRTAGVSAAVSSALWFDFFLTEPYQQFTITDRDDLETMVLLLLVGIAVTEVALWGRRQQARASRQEGFLGGILSAASGAAGGNVPREVLTADVAARIADVLRLDDCRFDAAHGDRLPCLSRDGSITWQGMTVDVERDGLPTDTRIELPVESGGVSHGRFLLTASTRVRRPDLQQRLVAIALADQVGAALTSQTPLGR